MTITKRFKNANPVLEKKMLEPMQTNGQRVDLSSELNKLKATKCYSSHGAQTDASAHALQSLLYSVTMLKMSIWPKALILDVMFSLIEGRGANGKAVLDGRLACSFESSALDGIQVTFTLRRTTGQRSNFMVEFVLCERCLIPRTSLKSGNFIKDIPDVPPAQLEQPNPVGLENKVWASNLQVRNSNCFTIVLLLPDEFKHGVNYFEIGTETS